VSISIGDSGKRLALLRDSDGRAGDGLVAGFHKSALRKAGAERCQKKRENTERPVHALLEERVDAQA
jgi:hypothetical protein